LIKKKKIAHTTFKRYNNPNNYNTFKLLRQQIKLESYNAYNSYLNRIQSDLSLNPKRFWNFVRSKKQDSSIPQSMSLNEVSANSSQDIANLFGNYFSSVFSPNNNPLTPITSLSNFNTVNLNNIDFTLGDILESLSLLKPKCSYGPDGILPIILRNCCYSLAIPIYTLFKLSLSSSSFTTLWKSSYIQPIFKSGARSNFENYRPISILSAIPKFFDKLLATKINYYFKNIFI